MKGLSFHVVAVLSLTFWALMQNIHLSFIHGAWKKKDTTWWLWKLIVLMIHKINHWVLSTLSFHFIFSSLFLFFFLFPFHFKKDCGRVVPLHFLSIIHSLVLFGTLFQTFRTMEPFSLYSFFSISFFLFILRRPLFTFNFLHIIFSFVFLSSLSFLLFFSKIDTLNILCWPFSNSLLYFFFIFFPSSFLRGLVPLYSSANSMP